MVPTDEAKITRQILSAPESCESTAVLLAIKPPAKALIGARMPVSGSAQTQSAKKRSRNQSQSCPERDGQNCSGRPRNLPVHICRGVQCQVTGLLQGVCGERGWSNGTDAAIEFMT